MTPFWASGFFVFLTLFQRGHFCHLVLKCELLDFNEARSNRLGLFRRRLGAGAGGGVPPEMAGETQKGRASLEEEEASGKEEAEGWRSTKAFCARREVSKSQMEEGPSPEETSCSSPSLFPSSFLQPPAPHLRSGLTLLRLDLSADCASSAPTRLPGSSPAPETALPASWVDTLGLRRAK